MTSLSTLPDFARPSSLSNYKNFIVLSSCLEDNTRRLTYGWTVWCLSGLETQLLRVIP